MMSNGAGRSMSGPSDYGKGDRPRPVDRKKWDESWRRYEEAKKKVVRKVKK